MNLRQKLENAKNGLARAANIESPDRTFFIPTRDIFWVGIDLLNELDCNDSQNIDKADALIDAILICALTYEIDFWQHADEQRILTRYGLKALYAKTWKEITPSGNKLDFRDMQRFKEALKKIIPAVSEKVLNKELPPINQDNLTPGGLMKSIFMLVKEGGIKTHQKNDTATKEETEQKKDAQPSLTQNNSTNQNVTATKEETDHKKNPPFPPSESGNDNYPQQYKEQENKTKLLYILGLVAVVFVTFISPLSLFFTVPALANQRKKNPGAALDSQGLVISAIACIPIISGIISFMALGMLIENRRKNYPIQESIYTEEEFTQKQAPKAGTNSLAIHQKLKPNSSEVIVIVHVEEKGIKKVKVYQSRGQARTKNGLFQAQPGRGVVASTQPLKTHAASSKSRNH